MQNMFELDMGWVGFKTLYSGMFINYSINNLDIKVPLFQRFLSFYALSFKLCAKLKVTSRSGF